MIIRDANQQVNIAAASDVTVSLGAKQKNSTWLHCLDDASNYGSDQAFGYLPGTPVSTIKNIRL